MIRNQPRPTLFPYTTLFRSKTALANAEAPVREFMIAQIENGGNEDDVDLFTEFANKPRAKTWDDVGTMKLVDRKSTRLNSSHGYISYAGVSLKKKNLKDRML